MRLFSLLPVFLLPALILTTPTQPDAATSAKVADIAERADISSLIDTFTGDLSGIVSLLRPETLKNIDSIITHVALLLDDKTTNQTKSLLNTADDLLSGNLFSSISGLVTPDFIKKVGGLIDNANNLLTPTFVKETTGLINDVAPVSVGS